MNKFVKYTLFSVVMIVLLLGSFSGGFVTGHLSALGGGLFGMPGAAAAPQATNMPSVSTPDGSSQATPEELESLFVPFWETWELIHTQYVDQPVDDVALMRGAIRGMLQSLGDEHTSFMDPDQYTQANMAMSGEYDGIGAWVDPSGDYLTIISPMPGSPAEAAGLQPGDRIMKIDGDDMTGIPGDLVIRRVLGPAGTVVRLTVARENEPELLEFDVTRARIVVASVESRMLENDIAYIKLNTFGDKSADELRDALREMMDQNPRGLVFDLRNNGGGYLQTAVQVASQFIGDGVVLIERYGDGSQDVYEAQRGGLATDIPLVVLVNEGTASASEIVAGAIQDYERGKLVGTITFGKGSVQIWSPLSDNQGAVRVTIAKWLTPDERAIHGEGLTPDILVELTQEDVAAERDPQLEKALEVLEALISGATE